MRVAPICVGLLLAWTTATFAGAGINFSQNTCWSDGGVNSVTFACNNNSGNAITAFGSVIPPADMGQFIGVATVLDIQIASPALNAWWTVIAGGCRPNAIAQDFQPANLDPIGGNGTPCPDIWGGNPPVAVADVQNGLGGPNRIRVRGGAALPGDLAQVISADGSTEYNVYRVTLARTKSTGTGACAGCTTGACFVLSEVQLVQPAGVGDYRVVSPAMNNYIVYNGGIGIGACPAATPAVNRSWGAVKSLYR